MSVASLQFPIQESSQVGQARRTATQWAERWGWDEVATGHSAIVINELGTNLVKHAREGMLILREVGGGGGCGLEILSIDRGPGIADLTRCLDDGYSTSGTAGTGLGAVRRLSSEWDIFSQPGAGTVQLARLGCRLAGEAGDVRVSGLSVAAPGETECGDAWMALCHESVLRIAVADGLGHGPSAAEASREAIASFTANPHLRPAEALQKMHEALRATRGAAVAVAEFDAPARKLRYAGVGNIGAIITSAEKTQNLVSVNGTLGAQSPKPREFEYDLPAGSVVVFYSDGLTSHVRLDAYPGLVQRDPAVIAGVLYRDFKRGRDDATVVVASLG